MKIKLINFSKRELIERKKERGESMKIECTVDELKELVKNENIKIDKEKLLNVVNEELGKQI